MDNLITAELLTAMGVHPKRSAELFDSLQAAATEFGIDTPLEVAHWLAQLCHESRCFEYVRELWDGKGAQSRYEGRVDLGNTERGDGYKYRGRGWIQTTGRTNTERALRKLGYEPGDVDKLETPEGAARSSALFWRDHALDEVAIRAGADVRRVTRVINGGYNGLADRQAYFDKAMTYMAKIYLPASAELI